MPLNSITSDPDPPPDDAAPTQSQGADRGDDIGSGYGSPEDDPQPTYSAVTFALGAVAGVVAVSLGWRWLEPPIAETGRWRLLLATVTYVAPLFLMAYAVATAWRDTRGPRVLYALGALFYAAVAGPLAAAPASDLVLGAEVGPAMVLATYDCDLAAGDVEHELTCVELAWLSSGQTKRTRFTIDSSVLGPEEQRPGSCVQTVIWPQTERLVGVESTRASECHRQLAR